MVACLKTRSRERVDAWGDVEIRLPKILTPARKYRLLQRSRPRKKISARRAPRAQERGPTRIADLPFATRYPRGQEANVKSKAPLETDIFKWSFDSNICKSAC